MLPKVRSQSAGSLPARGASQIRDLLTVLEDNYKVHQEETAADKQLTFAAFSRSWLAHNPPERVYQSIGNLLLTFADGQQASLSPMDNGPGDDELPDAGAIPMTGNLEGKGRLPSAGHVVPLGGR